MQPRFTERSHSAIFSGVRSLLGLGALLVAAFAAEAPPADYVLQPMDILRVQVFQEEDINRLGEVSVSQEHTIVLPLIKTVSVKGKTARQVEEQVRELYKKGYLVNPEVQVIVLKYAERSVNVMGAVTNPGRVMFSGEGRLTLLEAIGNAGGPSRIANMKKVTLTRKRANGDSTSQEINAEDLRTRGGQDIPLEKGDVIFVAERVF